MRVIVQDVFSIETIIKVHRGVGELGVGSGGVLTLERSVDVHLLSGVVLLRTKKDASVLLKA